jgi:thymidylate synthase (FAD)
MPTVAGVEYSLPQVTLLQHTGIGTSEVAARTCYDSFDSSENPEIRFFHANLTDTWCTNVNDIEHSDLLDQLAWTHFHHSILEHASLTYLIQGTSRGVLQEHARHRLQSISVRSTRYTMQSILHAFNASFIEQPAFRKRAFMNLILPMNMFVVTGHAAIIEAEHMYDKLFMQFQELGQSQFISLSMGKSAQDIFENQDLFSGPEELYMALIDAKAKRNVGDNFKWIVTDNWKVDMVVTMNLRALKNYLQLRDSGAAYFGIQWLAQAIKAVTPSKYLDLIIKGAANEAQKASV